MHKLYSWITVPPEIVVKKKSAFQSPSVPRAREEKGVWSGARREPWQPCSPAAALGGCSCSPHSEPDPKSPPPPAKPPAGCSLVGMEEVAMTLVGGLSPDPIACRSPAAAPEQESQQQRGGTGPRTALFPDGHRPSVPSVLDIPAEPFSRSPAVTRWQFPSSCSPLGNMPQPGDTTAPCARAQPGGNVCRGGMEPSPTCLHSWGAGGARDGCFHPPDRVVLAASLRRAPGSGLGGHCHLAPIRRAPLSGRRLCRSSAHANYPARSL